MKKRLTMQSSRSLRSLGHLTAPRLCYRKVTAPSNAAYCGVRQKYKGVHEVYIWKTKSLISELREDKVSEIEKLKYVIFMGVVYAVFSDPLVVFSVEYSYIAVINLVSVVLITVLGTIYAFKKNSSGDNKHFVTRYICLGVPIGVKIFLLALILGILVAIIDTELLGQGFEYSEEVIPQPTSFTQVVVTALVLVLYYFYLGKAIRETAT